MAIVRQADSDKQAVCLFPGCGKEFASIRNGKRHFRTTHQIMEPKSCIICQKQFKNDDVMTNHLKKDHQVTKKEVAEAKKIGMAKQDFLLVIGQKNVVIYIGSPDLYIFLLFIFYFLLELLLFLNRFAAPLLVRDHPVKKNFHRLEMPNDITRICMPALILWKIMMRKKIETNLYRFCYF